MSKHRISVTDETSRCVSYDVREKEIKLTCKLAHLSDIYNRLTDRTILNKEGQLKDIIITIYGDKCRHHSKKIPTLIIDSKDSKWLKIFDDRKIAYPIIVQVDLNRSVKVTIMGSEYLMTMSNLILKYCKIKNMSTQYRCCSKTLYHD